MIASLILALHLLGFMSASSASTFLYITGALLIISEFFVASFGIIALNGLLALFVAYSMQTGDNTVLGVPIDWSLLFGIAFIELAIIVFAVMIIQRIRKKKVTTGIEGMIGQKAVVIEWKGQKGRVRIQGEIWAAKSEKELELSKDEEVSVISVEDLVLTIEV